LKEKVQSKNKMEQREKEMLIVMKSPNGKEKQKEWYHP
jgi:hypothetical protein